MMNNRFLTVDKIIEDLIQIHDLLEKHDITSHIQQDEYITKDGRRFNVYIKYERDK